MLLRIIFQSDDFVLTDRVEQALSEALQQTSLGTITDGASSLGTVSYNIEVSDPVRAVATIREALGGFALPPSASIRQFSPEHVVRPLKTPVA